MLKISPANAKLQKLAEKTGGKVYSLDLPAGHSCPFADKCKSRAVETVEGWRIFDGPNCEFRCYAATSEVIFAKTRNLRWHNLWLLRGAKTVKRMANEVLKAIPKRCTILRLHSAGDYFSKAYFRAILRAAWERPDIHFYGYTKALPYWIEYRNEVKETPNLHLVASHGGKRDDLISRYNLDSCRVVLTKGEARKLCLDIDHDDRYASGFVYRHNFAVLIHGTQPLGSPAGKARWANMRRGIGGYRVGKGYGLHKNKKRKAVAS